MKYICVSNKNNNLRALYYSKKLHRQRVYRRDFQMFSYDEFEIFAYKKKNNAQKLCDDVNENLKEDFKVVEYILPVSNILKQLNKEIKTKN